MPVVLEILNLHLDPCMFQPKNPHSWVQVLVTMGGNNMKKYYFKAFRSHTIWVQIWVLYSL